jgi:hypothetical protein
MHQRLWVVCAMACALAAIPGQTLAVSTPPTPCCLAEWAHVTSYVGTVSGDARKTGPDAFTTQFQTPQMVLKRMTPPSSQGPDIIFEGSGPLSATAVGHCGSSSTSGTYTVVIVITITQHPAYLIRGGGAGDVTYSSCRGADGSITKPYTERLAKDLFAKQIIFPAPGPSRLMRAASEGVCATQSRDSVGEGWSETDHYSFKFKAIMDNVGSSQPICTVIMGDQ